MGFGLWLKDLFNKFIAAFNSFIKEAFNQEMKLIIGEFKDLAILIITELSVKDLTNEVKRAEAFKAIKEAAIAKGKELSDSMINVLIELAVSKLKATTVNA